MGVTRPLHNFLGKVAPSRGIFYKGEGSGGGQKIVAGHRSNLATAATWPLQHFIAIEWMTDKKVWAFQVSYWAAAVGGIFWYLITI